MVVVLSILHTMRWGREDILSLFCSLLTYRCLIELLQHTLNDLFFELSMTNLAILCCNKRLNWSSLSLMGLNWIQPDPAIYDVSHLCLRLWNGNRWINELYRRHRSGSSILVSAHVLILYLCCVVSSIFLEGKFEDMPMPLHMFQWPCASEIWSGIFWNFNLRSGTSWEFTS